MVKEASVAGLKCVGSPGDLWEFWASNLDGFHKKQIWIVCSFKKKNWMVWGGNRIWMGMHGTVGSAVSARSC